MMHAMNITKCVQSSREQGSDLKRELPSRHSVLNMQKQQKAPDISCVSGLIQSKFKSWKLKVVNNHLFPRWKKKIGGLCVVHIQGKTSIAISGISART